MSTVELSDVRNVFESHQWNVTDEFDGGQWSITARTPDEIRVAIDEPTTTQDINDVFVKSPPIGITSVSEFEKAKEAAGRNTTVTVLDSGFTRVKANNDIQAKESEVIERLTEESEAPIKIQFVVVDSLTEIEMSDVEHLVDCVSDAMTAFRT